jgi:hypothetical protein
MAWMLPALKRLAAGGASDAERRDRYLSCRQTTRGFNNAIFKCLSRDDLQRGARDLGMFHRNTIVWANEAEMAVFADHCIYDVRRQGQTAVERFAAASEAPPGSQERLMLDAMVRSRYALLQVRRAVGSAGLAVTDLFREEEGILCDVSFAATIPRGFVLATRVLYPESEDFWMTSGAALPVLPDGLMRIADILGELGADGWAEFVRLDREDLNSLTTRILRTLVRSGVTDFIAYSESGAREREDPPLLRLLPPETEFSLDAEQTAFSANSRMLRGPSRIELPQRVGRNDPCPCGSGRKFKKCCGP